MLCELGRYAETEQAYRQAISRDSRSAERAQGRCAEAAAYLREARRLKAARF
jgi:hypothetical protein